MESGAAGGDQRVHEAAKNGDRSENGDYIYGKRRLREIDSRVRFLNKRLDELEVVQRAPDDTSKIFFGAWVTLEDEDGEEHAGASSARTSSTWAQANSAWIPPWPEHCWAKPWTTKSWCTAPPGEHATYVTESLHQLTLRSAHRNVLERYSTPTDAVRGLLGRAPSGWRDTIACSSNRFSTFRNTTPRH